MVAPDAQEGMGGHVQQVSKTSPPRPFAECHSLSSGLSFCCCWLTVCSSCDDWPRHQQIIYHPSCPFTMHTEIPTSGEPALSRYSMLQQILNSVLLGPWQIVFCSAAASPSYHVEVSVPRATGGQIIKAIVGKSTTSSSCWMVTDHQHLPVSDTAVSDALRRTFGHRQIASVVDCKETCCQQAVATAL